MKLTTVICLGLLVACAYSNCFCDSGQYFDAASWTCKEPTTPTENCYQYMKGDDSSIKCMACNSGYYLDTNTKCVAETAAIDNCKFTRRSDSANKVVCQDCEKGYYEKDGACIANPDTPANCEEFRWSSSSSKVKCDSCEEGYYSKDDGTCAANPTTNDKCKMWASDTICVACIDTHYRDVDMSCKELAADFTTQDGCMFYQKANDNASVSCGYCTPYEYGEKDSKCTACPFVYNPDSANVLAFSALLVAFVALLL